MKTKGIIILTSILVIASGITAYVIIKRAKTKKAKADCVKNGGIYNEVTKTCELPIPTIPLKTEEIYIAKDDPRFGKGLGVLALPKQPIPTITTSETIKPHVPNFMKGIV